MRRDTRLLHYGAPLRPGPANPPVVRASTILHNSVESYRETKRQRENDDGVLSYGRRGTTSAHCLMQAVADLEGGDAAYLFPTGVAALAGALGAFLGSGDHALVADTVFSPTRKLFEKVLRRYGVTVDYFPADVVDLSAMVAENTRLVFLESPGSQTFEVLNVPALAASAHEHGLRVLIDNTYASGWLSQPLELGCDISIIAGTKYIGGHSDVMMGAVCAKGEAVAPLREYVHLAGQTMAPDEAWNALRGMRTLSVRMPRHHESGLDIARWFEQRSEVARVLHPAFVGQMGHELWKRDFSGANGLFTVEFEPDFEPLLTSFIDALTLFAVGSSWGGYESLVMPIDPYAERVFAPGLTSGPMARFHVGLEDVGDLVADLERAMDTVDR